jgi:aryl-alcohol dehydrogenase-like predicted oxidoreductase
MLTRRFGRLGTVSALTIGGGGIGQVWGATSREESVATLRAAIDAGITLIDVAPTYGRDGEAERVVGAAFGGRLPAGVRVATKVALRAPWSTVGTEPITAELIERALHDSVERLQLDFVDLYLLHDMIVPESGPEGEPGTPLAVYRETVRPVFEGLVRAGRIGAWGISARGVSSALHAALADDPPPAAAQVVANALEFDTSLAATAEARGVATMGIQPVHSGALSDGFDREVARPMAALFERAAPLRALAAELGESTPIVAQRYALGLPHVSTVVIGVKNRRELEDALRAEAAGPLPADVATQITEALRQPGIGPTDS